MFAWIERFKTGAIAVVTAAALFVAVYLCGRRVGTLVEREQHASKINDQAVKARQEVKDVQLETARMDDDAIVAELERDWVRGPGPSGT